MKRCSKCGEEKSLECFGNLSSSKDGLSYWCKDCSHASAKKSRASPESKARKKIREKEYNSDPNVRAKRRTAVKRYYAKNPQAKLAHSYVSRALKLGTLVKLPCEKCGSSEVEAHHDDYSQPLNVRWLCKVHHDEFHASI